MIGKRLKKLRNEKGISQEELANILKLSRSTYAQYEIDRRIPEYGTLEKLADYYNVSLDYLVGRSDYKNIMKDNEWLFAQLDLSDDIIISKVPMFYEGMELTTSEKKEFLAIVRGIFSVRKGDQENH